MRMQIMHNHLNCVFGASQQEANIELNLKTASRFQRSRHTLDTPAQSNSLQEESLNYNSVE